MAGLRRSLRASSEGNIKIASSLRYSIGEFERLAMSNAKDAYETHYNGLQVMSSHLSCRSIPLSLIVYSNTTHILQSNSSSGLTLLDELIEISIAAADQSKASQELNPERTSFNGSSSPTNKGAALLTVDGKIFSACDIMSNDHNGISAERSAVLNAVSEGHNRFQVRALPLINFSLPTQ